MSTIRPVFPVLVFQLSKQQNRTRATSSTVLGIPPNRTRTKTFPLEVLWGGCFVRWVLKWESTENWDFHRLEPYPKPYSDTSWHWSTHAFQGKFVWTNGSQILVFRAEFVWTNGAECPSTVSKLTGIGPWMALRERSKILSYSRRPLQMIWEKLNRGVSKPGGFQTGGFPTFFGKGSDCVADPFGTVPRRCS